MIIIEVFKLFGSILVDTDKANKSIGKTEKQTDSLSKKLGRGIKTAGKWAAGLTAAAVGVAAGAFAMTKKITGNFDDIAKSSTKLGVSTDAYQEMDYWASQNGLSSEQMEKGVRRLNQRIGEARAGNEKYSDALKNLGVDMGAVEDGTISTEDAMYQSIQSLSEMTNEQDKAALASELFGKKMATDLMPALQDGSLSLEDAKKKAHELGIVIEEDTLNAAEDFNDTWDDMTRMLSAVGQKIIAKLIPIFQSMMDWVMDHMPQIQAVFQTVFGVIGEVFGTAIEWVQSLISWFSEWFTTNEETMNGIWETIVLTFENILEFLTMTWEFIKEAWSEYGEQLIEGFMFVFNHIWEFLQEIFELIMPFIQDTLNSLYEFWQEHGEQIMESIGNAFEFIKEVIDTVMPYIQGVIEVAWDLISTIFNTALDIIMGIIQAFAAAFTGDWEGLWNAVKGIAESAWNGIKSIISTVANAIKGLVSGVFNSVKSIITNVWNGIKSTTSSVWNGIKSTLNRIWSGIRTSVKTSFTAVQNAVTNVWNNIKSRTRSIWEGITNVVKAPVNTIIGFINGMIDALNGINIKVPKVPDWVPFIGGKGGNTIGFNIPNVPSLDVGTNFVAGDGLAMLHRGEAVVPKEYNPAAGGISNNGQILSLLTELINAVRENRDVYIDGSKVTDFVNDDNAVRSLVGEYMN